MIEEAIKSSGWEQHT